MSRGPGAVRNPTTCARGALLLLQWAAVPVTIETLPSRHCPRRYQCRELLTASAALVGTLAAPPLLAASVADAADAGAAALWALAPVARRLAAVTPPFWRACLLGHPAETSTAGPRLCLFLLPSPHFSY